MFINETNISVNVEPEVSGMEIVVSIISGIKSKIQKYTVVYIINSKPANSTI